MKYIILLAVLCVSFPVLAQKEEKSIWNWSHGLHSVKNWPNNHWKGQNFQPTITPEGQLIAKNTQMNRSMFSDMEGIKPEQFIENLKQARIIKGAFRETQGFWKPIPTDHVTIELDHNFYTLSLPDQMVIADLLAKSFNQDHYILKDASTKNIVGQITPGGLSLF